MTANKIKMTAEENRAHFLELAIMRRKNKLGGFGLSETLLLFGTDDQISNKLYHRLSQSQSFQFAIEQVVNTYPKAEDQSDDSSAKNAKRSKMSLPMDHAGYLTRAVMQRKSDLGYLGLSETLLLFGGDDHISKDLNKRLRHDVAFLFGFEQIVKTYPNMTGQKGYLPKAPFRLPNNAGDAVGGSGIDPGQQLNNYDAKLEAMQAEIKRLNARVAALEAKAEEQNSEL